VVTVYFADGSSAEHDVLVGADGIDSLVHRTLWGDAPGRHDERLWVRTHLFGTVPSTSAKVKPPKMWSRCSRFKDPLHDQVADSSPA
jgi:2-polyprenyl-6-methoxyphenol hydroxylase-like FAD-dependent oxidoreductase